MIELMRNYLYDKTPEIFVVVFVIRGIYEPQRTPRSQSVIFFLCDLGDLYALYSVAGTQLRRR